VSFLRELRTADRFGAAPLSPTLDDVMAFSSRLFS
jgi:hypothetical protein